MPSDPDQPRSGRRRAAYAVLAMLALLASPVSGQIGPAGAERDTLPFSVPHAEVLRSLAAMPEIVVLPLNLAAADLLAEVRPTAGRPVTRVALADASGTIAVIYPDIGDPYRGIFTKIIEGVESRAKSPVVSLALAEGTDAASLRSALKARDVRVVIALGRQGLKAADGLGREFGVVIGGVVAVPEEAARNLSVISLSPDPALLFARLKALTPGVRRVHVIYDPRQNGWLIRLAREAAREQGLELVAQEASDLKTAVRLYQDVLASANPDRDALWLPQDATTVEEGAVLPLVLQESWDRRLTVFSSSIGHVKRGVLFSLYPDNVGLGRNLAGSAQGFLADAEPARGLTPLRDVQAAINLRTAKHLGLNLGSQPQRSFDLVFTGQ